MGVNWASEICPGFPEALPGLSDLAARLLSRAVAVEVNLRWLARFTATPNVHTLAPVNESLAAAFGRNAITNGSSIMINEK